MLPKPFYFDDSIWGADTWPLLSAAYTGDLDVVRQMLVDDPARVKAQYAYYEPLHYAVRGGSLPMVEAVAGLLTNSDRRRTMGEAARRRCVERFSLDAVAACWWGFLEPLVERGPRGADA